MAERADVDPSKLILRVEAICSASGEWLYRASFPEVPDAGATAPHVLDAILAAELRLPGLRAADST